MHAYTFAGDVHLLRHPPPQSPSTPHAKGHADATAATRRADACRCQRPTPQHTLLDIQCLQRLSFAHADAVETGDGTVRMHIRITRRDVRRFAKYSTNQDR